MTRNLPLAISYCFAISVTASAQNVAPVVTTPDRAIHGLCRRASALDWSHHGVCRSGRVERGPAERVASLKHRHLHYCARRTIQTSHGRQFSELRKFWAVFPDRPDDTYARIELYPSFCSRFRRARRRIYRHCRSGTPEQRSADAGHDFPADSEWAGHLEQKRHYWQKSPVTQTAPPASGSSISRTMEVRRPISTHKTAVLPFLVTSRAMGWQPWMRSQRCRFLILVPLLSPCHCATTRRLTRSKSRI